MTDAGIKDMFASSRSGELVRICRGSFPRSMSSALNVVHSVVIRIVVVQVYFTSLNSALVVSTFGV